MLDWMRVSKLSLNPAKSEVLQVSGSCVQVVGQLPVLKEQIFSWRGTPPSIFDLDGEVICVAFYQL